MKVAVWVPNGSGHRLNYASILQTGTLKSGNNFNLLAKKEVLNSQEWAIRESDFKNTQVFRISNLSDAFSFCVDQDITKLVIPDGDSEVLSLLRLRRKLKHINISLLLMRPRPQTGLASHFKVSVKYLVVHFLAMNSNISAYELNSAKSNWWKKFGFQALKDPSDDIALPPDFKPDFSPILEGKVIFSVLGVIDARKNPLAVLQGFKAAQISNSVLVIAGKFSEAVQSQLRSAAYSLKDVILIDRKISDLEFSWLLKHSDALVCIYDNIGSSGIVTNAEEFGNVVVGGGNIRTVEEMRILSSRFVSVLDKDPHAIAHGLKLASELQTENCKISTSELRDLTELL